MTLFRASTASFLLILIAACSGGSGGNGGTSSDGGTSDGGNGGDGGGGGGDGGGGGGSCSSTAHATMIADPFVGLAPSLDGSDVYYIDPTQGPDTGGGILTGVISHIKTDGTGGETIFTPTTRPIFAATVQGANVYFFQLEADTGSGSPMHLYSIPRAGGTATQVSTYDFSAVNLETTIEAPTAEYRIGIFASQGTDVFMDEVTAISRISLTDGTRTVIADGSSAQIFYPTLIGTNILYTGLDGATASNDLYSVPISATTASGTKIGTQSCGSTTSQWASPWSGGWICGRVFGLDAVDATGANKTSFYDTKPTDSVYNPSPIDGTTFYAFGNGSGDTNNPIRPLLKMDTATPNAGTTVLCLDPVATWNARISTSDLIWEQYESTSSAVRTLRRIAR